MEKNTLLKYSHITIFGLKNVGLNLKQKKNKNTHTHTQITSIRYYVILSVLFKYQLSQGDEGTLRPLGPAVAVGFMTFR